MKKFTVIFTLLVLAIFGGLVTHVSTTEDFVKPTEPTVAPEAPVWSKSIDELVDYLYDKGLLKNKDRFPWTEGYATESFMIAGVHLSWWDVENLEESTNEYRVWHEYQETGYCDVYENGLVSTAQLNGPFGIDIGYYEGDEEALYEAFYAFGREE